MVRASCGLSFLLTLITLPPSPPWAKPPVARALCGPTEVDIDHATPPPPPQRGSPPWPEPRVAQWKLALITMPPPSPLWAESCVAQQKLTLITLPPSPLWPASCGPTEVDIDHAKPNIATVHRGGMAGEAWQGRHGRGGVWQEVHGRRGTWRGRRVAEETHAEGGGAVINVNFRGREGAPSSGVDNGADIVKLRSISNIRGQHTRNAYLHLWNGFPENDKEEKY